MTTGEERSFWPAIGVPGREELDAVALDRAALGMSVSSAALRSASGSTPPCFLMARGSTSVRKIQDWLKPIEACGGTSAGPFSAL